ncbi:rod shape-determining protein MreC [Aciduricibacillus chroicocephali]|uniref:Cell shape-determining protein MreC n=1 Tax=Aciduricibacillus chroicocephali TaxID=3054939 RepID=A0ABY9KSC1_9BACI|nr:rod shape-determining protein MreC [Bacillaceae bacterium 44XB]
MSFFRKKGLFILLIGIILLVVLVGYSLSGRDGVTLPEQMMKDATGGAQKIVSAPVRFVKGIGTNISDIRNAYEENRQLKKKISEYKGMDYHIQKLKEENDELRAQLHITESIRDYTPIQATVISRSPERWVEQVTINKGKHDGVKENMAVRTADGMVGKIRSAAQFSSTVQLLSGFDQFNRISATIARKKGKDVFGMVEGFDVESKYLTFRIIEESEQNVKKGEKVYSSGLGGKFPAGLLIGKVKEVKPDQYGLTETALIEPAADLYNLNNVIVVDRSLETDNATDEPEEGDDGQ